MPKTTKKPKPASATPTPKVTKAATEPPPKAKTKAAPPPPPPTPKPTGAQPRDERLPAPGTVLQKRHGKTVCECRVETDGVTHRGTHYRSLSAAAAAAAEFLGLKGRSYNGYVFWGLVKPPRATRDPQEALGKAWARYHARLQELITADMPDDARKQIRVEIQKYVAALAEISKEL